MDRQALIGRYLLALALLLFALLHLSNAGNSTLSQVGPPWVTGNPLFTGAAGIALLVGAATLILGRNSDLVLGVLGAGLLIYALAFYLPGIIEKIHAPGPWTSGAELISLCGALLACSGTPASASSPGSNPTRPAFRIGSILYAAPLLVFAAQHFLYAEFVGTLIPAWIPGHLFLACAVGAGFLAAALSIISGRLAWWGATLLGAQFLIWVLILHLPRALAANKSGDEWTSLVVALAMGGGAWVVAAGFPRLNHTS